MHEQVQRLIGRPLTDKERKLLDWLNGWDEETVLTFTNLFQAANRFGHISGKEDKPYET